jgi:adenylate kinase family enzyme
MKRILIVGTTGSGKTTLGLKLSSILGIPATDLDELYWLPEWKGRPEDEFKKSVMDVIEKDTWIISGNYSIVRDLIVARADTVIWLDYSFVRNFWQIFSRSIHRVVSQKSICNGNRETLAKLFSKDSIMLWFFNTFHDRRRRYGEMISEWRQSGKECIHLRSPGEAADFLTARA